MDSFDQLIELVHEARDSYKNFLNKNQDVSVDQAFMNYYKSRQICEEIQEKMDKIEMRKEGSGYGYDNCVYYMAKDYLNTYQYHTLLVLTHKLGEGSKQLAETRAEDKQKESLKHLIKEALREEREMEEKSKPIKVTKRKTKSRS